MAGTSYSSQLGGDYHECLEYQMATPAARRQINRYKKECNISDDHMFLIMFKRELDAVPKERRDSADLPGKAMLAMGGLALWNGLIMIQDGRAQQSWYVVIISVAAFVMALVLYFSGMLNDYRRAVRRVDKLLKEQPEVPDMDEWFAEHPAPAAKPQKRKRR